MPADARFFLEDGHTEVLARLAESVSGRKADDAAADDNNVGSSHG